MSDGTDTNGHRYEYHPDTNIKIKGFKIPRWTDIITICKNAHNIVPNAPIVGWDVCVTSNNEIEIIEGNHMPDVDVLQSPLKIGIRQRVEEMFGNTAI